MSWNRVLVTGATSAIGKALAERLAKDGCNLVLMARDSDEIERVISDLRIRWPIEVEAMSFDATDIESNQSLISDMTRAGDLDGAILCHGYMADQLQAERCWEDAERMITVNYSSYIGLCSALAQYFRRQGHGFLCAVSSVAGDRGRQSNFVYGSTKGGLSVYLQGLRNALYPHNVRVLTVKPGFVDTGMTWGVVNRNSPLLASSERIADDVIEGIRKNKDVIYTPWFWRWIMLILKSIPETVFKRLKL